MRRPILPLVLAVVAAACGGGGGGGTGPTPSTPGSGAVLAWAGSATKTFHYVIQTVDGTFTWEITNVLWVTDTDPFLTPLAGGSIYKIASGQVKVTVQQTSPGCTLTGEARFSLNPADGTMTVGANGAYAGSIRRRGADTVIVTPTCLGVTGRPGDLSVELALEIDSAADFGRSRDRLQGTKVTPSGANTHTSTWDFAVAARE